MNYATAVPDGPSGQQILVRSLASNEQALRAADREAFRSGAATAGAGLFLAVSPWVLNYRADDATVLAVVLGIVVAILALAGTRPDGATRWLGWLRSFLLAGVAVLATSAWSTSSGTAARDEAPPP